MAFFLFHFALNLSKKLSLCLFTISIICQKCAMAEKNSRRNLENIFSSLFSLLSLAVYNEIIHSKKLLKFLVVVFSFDLPMLENFIYQHVKDTQVILGLLS